MPRSRSGRRPRAAATATAVAALALVLSPAMPTTASDRHAEMRRMPVRGIVRPLNQAAMASDLSVRVAQLRVREAQSFRKGDVLLTFDCERLEAEQAAAEAVHREMKIALDSNVYLDKRGAVGRNDVEVSRARVDKAGADARALKARLRQCVVAAPFDGRVVELTISEHEIPAPGKPFITLVDEAAFEIDVIMPSLALKRLAPGQAFTFSVDETGQDYPAKVLRIGAAVDPVSQTVKVIAAFDNRDERVLPGMSGTASFPDQVGMPGAGAGR